MVYCKSDKEYFIMYAELESLDVPKIMEYFNNNWHNIRLEWTLNDQFVTDSLGNARTNRLESINAMLKYDSIKHFHGSICGIFP